MNNPFPDGLVDDRDNARIAVASGLSIFDSLEGLDGFTETRPMHPISLAPRFVLSHSFLSRLIIRHIVSPPTIA